MNLNDFNLEKRDSVYLLLVFLFSFFTIYKMIEFYMHCGIFDPDKAIYLIDALKFAGLDYYNICLSTDIFYTPVICFLTSVLFRLGLVDKLAIFIVTGIFGVLCEIGVYVFLRQRFNQILSFTGAVIFGSLSVVLLNIGSGGIDIPSIGISVWIIIFTVAAIEKDIKYFLVIFPLFVLGFFTRYTVGFILPVILIYYLLSKDVCKNFNCLINDKKLFKERFVNYLHSREFKYIALSILLGLILAIIICWFIIDNGGSLTFFQQSSNTFNGAKSNVLGVDFNRSRMYYLNNIFGILFEDCRLLDTALSFSLLLILFSGVLIIFKNYFKTFVKKFKNNSFLNNIFKIIFVLSFLGILFGFVFMRNHMVSNICVMINVICLYCIMGDSKFNIKLNLLSVSWFCITFIFASLYEVKVFRYFIPIVVPFVYLIILSFENILIELTNLYNHFTQEKRTYSLKSKINILPLILVIVLLFSSFVFVQETVYDVRGEIGLGLVDATDYIINHDSEYHSKEIISDEHLFTVAKWYLNVNGTMLRDYEIDSADNHNASYLILKQDRDFENYHEIYHSKGIYLYAYNSNS